MGRMDSSISIKLGIQPFNSDFRGLFLRNSL